MQKATIIAGQRYGTTVYAIVSDNAFNMQSMGTSSVEILNLLYTTCDAHSANLLAGDIIKKPQYSKIMSKVMLVQKDFKRTRLEDRSLKAGGKKTSSIMHNTLDKSKKRS